MRYLIILLVTLAFPVTTGAATLHVPGQYPAIQDAIDAAMNGDTVLVAPGTYTENIIFKGKAITVKSAGGAAATTIDGNQSGSVVTFKNGEGLDSVLEGFTLTNGKGTKTPPFGRSGGGIFCSDASPTITANRIWSNHVNGYGGGITCRGGAPTIIRNIISSNTAVSYGGGGISCSSGSVPTIQGNIISENEGQHWGGGIIITDSSPIITGNVLVENHSIKGGGLYGSEAMTAANNVFYSNSATSFGGGLFSSNPDTLIINSILRENTAPLGIEISGSPTVSYCNVKGWWPGTGNIDSDPLFVDPDNGDFHLTYPSPCKDAGDNLAVLALFDFEGDPRIAYGTVDMGADEFYPHLYYTGDATPGSDVEIKFVGLPDTAPVGLIFGTGVLDPPIPSMWGDWFLQFPIIGPVDFGKIPSPEGVLVYQATIPGTPPAPYSAPMQALIGGTLTNLCVLEVR